MSHSCGMKTVYEAASAVEAHMVRDLLRQAGIAAHIHGEHLQGAVGELPAAGLVRVAVDEDDYVRGRSVIEDWERSQPQDIPPPSTARRPSRTPFVFLAGAVLGAGLMWAFHRVPATLDGVDYNGDGVLDTRYHYSASGTLLRVESDRNADGRIDSITRYDRRGQPEVGETDDDFDGTFEGHWFFRAGNAELVEVDSDGDGVVDLRTRYRGDVAQSMAFLDPHTGLALRVEHYRAGKIVRAQLDTDHDGRLDTEQEYGPLNDVRVVRRLPAPEGEPVR